MVQQSYGDSAKVLTNEWHKQRRIATFQSFRIDEFDDLDIVRYDLDEITPRRGAKKSSYVTEARLETEGSAQADIDIRTIDKTRD